MNARLRSLVLPFALALLGAAAVLVRPMPVLAQAQAAAFAQTLDPASRKVFEDWLAARTFHDFQLDKFWREVSDKRSVRRQKKAAGQALVAEDYVHAFPPEYKGPQLSAALAKAWGDFQAKAATKPPVKEIATLTDFVLSAKTIYAFTPERISEAEFKRRYAREALRVGLTKEQVVRVYALETGGQGTADMQAGISPLTKRGKAISSALGYAQLLHANSVNELVKHGASFLERLADELKRTGDAARQARLKAKIASLKRMLAAAKSVPNTWDAHVAYGSTPKGLGIHALNLDGDIGPWLQVIKLKGLKEEAEKAGVYTLKPNEMELMNLAGPATGLEMMLPVAHKVPTVNFFARGGYERNTIVRGKSAAELIVALDRRMDEGVTKPGAVEFAAAFDAAIAERRAGR